MKGTKLTAMLLSLALILTLLPVPIVAADPTLNINLSALTTNAARPNAAVLYFGTHENKPIRWQVIGHDDEGAAAKDGEITLLFKDVKDGSNDGSIGNSYFQKNEFSPNYSTSQLKDDLSNLYETKFTSNEQQAISSRNLTDVAGDAVNDQFLWPLHRNEVAGIHQDLLKFPYTWNLRFAEKVHLGGDRYGIWVHAVSNTGRYADQRQPATTLAPIRPAFALRKDRILMLSKADGTDKDGNPDPSLKSGPQPAGELKLTLRDDTRSFQVAPDSIRFSKEQNDQFIHFLYTGAKTGNNEYLSAIVTNAAGNIIKAYGRIQELTEAAGEAKIQLSGLQIEDTDQLLVFNEQYNGANKTDLASSPQHLLTFPVKANITTKFTHITANPNPPMSQDLFTALSMTLQPDSNDYFLPDDINIQVQVGGTVLEKGLNGYTYDPSSHQLTIPEDKVTGNITITAAATKKTYEASFSPDSIDFGTVYPNYTAIQPQAITIRNTGNQKLLIYPPEFTDPNFAQYYELNALRNDELDPKQEGSFSVNPKPNLPIGEYEATIRVIIHGHTTSGNSTEKIRKEISLKFAVRPRPSSPSYRIAVHPSQVNFGQLREGEAMPTQTLSIDNKGTGSLRIESITGHQADSPVDIDFQPATLSRGQSMQVILRPKAGLPAGEYEDTLTVQTSRKNVSEKISVKFRILPKNSYKTWEPKTNVPTDKAWTIRFSLPLDPASLNEENLFMTKADDPSKILPATFRLGDDKKTILIHAKEPFQMNTDYHLFIRGLRAESGKLLKENIQMKFTTTETKKP